MNGEVKPKKSIGSTQEINDIQHEIEVYTKKIEHEKINRRLINERHNTQSELLLKLQNQKRPQKVKKHPLKERVSVEKQPVKKKEDIFENPAPLFKEKAKKEFALDSVKILFKIISLRMKLIFYSWRIRSYEAKSRESGRKSMEHKRCLKS